MDIAQKYEAKLAKAKAELEKCNAKLSAIQAAVNDQAEDEALWFEAERITESYLQAALRRLHRVIEEQS